MGEVRIDLHAPGMTPLHRAGLAGLWMTVRALNNAKKLPKGSLPPTLDAEGLVLRWEDAQQDRFFNELFRSGFGVAKDGLIDLPALDTAARGAEARVALHRGILGTFLQHPKSRPGAKPKPYTYDIDDHHWMVSTVALDRYAHQELGKEPLFQDGQAQEVEIAGWMAPGATVRHWALGTSSKLTVSGAQLLALAFAPVGVFLFEIRSPRSRGRGQYAMAIPHFSDLEKYAKARSAYAGESHPVATVAASGGEAALKLLALMRAREVIRKVAKSPACTVILFGQVTWSRQQKSRTAVLEVAELTPEVLDAYDIAASELGPRVVRVPAKGKGKSYKPEHSFIATSASMDLIADNLALGRRWFSGFSELLTDTELRKAVRWDRKGLNEMVEHMKWSEEAQHLLVQACHEALKYRYGKIGERGRKEGADVQRLFEVENERIRVSFGRARTADTLRAALTDLWARAGKVPTLQRAWREVLPLLDEKHWRLARDLALLALASYAGSADEPTPMDEAQEDS